MSDWLAWSALCFGAWFLVIAVLGWQRGYIPTQASVLVKSRTVYRDDEPFAFWFNCLVLAAAGAALCWVAIAQLLQ